MCSPRPMRDQNLKMSASQSVAPKPLGASASGPVNANPSPSDWDEVRARLRDVQAKLDALSNEAKAAQAKMDAVLKHSADDGTIPSTQPLTRADCNKAGVVWNDRANVCGLGPNETTTLQSSISSKIASKPHGTAKRITKIEAHAKRKNTSLRRPPMGLVGWDPMRLRVYSHR